MARNVAVPTPAVLPPWPLVAIGGLVVVRSVAIMAALILGQWSSSRAFPAWISLLQVAIFFAPALLLTISGRRDRRAWSLGIYFLDVACTIAEPFIRRWAAPLPLVALALELRTDAFQGAMLVFFAAEFPRPPIKQSLVNAYRALFGVSLLVGLALAIINSSPAADVPMFSRRIAGWYFGVQYLLVPALIVAWIVKMRELGAADRRRAYLLLFAVVASVGAVLVVTVLRGAFGLELQRQSAGAWAVLFTLAVGVLPAAATYAALVQRVLPVSLILRAAARYLLSKTIVYVASALPLVAVFFYAIANVDRSIADVFSGVTGALLIGAVLAGVALTAARTKLLEAIDRQFGRRYVQAPGPLTELASLLRHVNAVERFTEVVATTVNAVFGSRAVIVALADGQGHLYTQQQSLPPLRRDSALAQLIGSSDDPLVVTFDPASPLMRLPAAEQRWLRDAEASLIAPMRGPDGDLLGAIVIADRRSELPYSESDQSDFGAIGSTCGLALYRIRTKESSSSGVAGVDAPARECVECGLLYGTDAIACKCGAPLQRAPVPLRLREELRFVRRIGSGAMGVVYEARDPAVHQPRAVKCLPEMDAALMGRLRREARTMAAVSHPNLATFYALTTWQASPLLVMEYCSRGTLSDQLRRGAMPIDRAFAICERIADALSYLHAHGIIHRDVKPSNIGFIEEMQPKLLDFGLAKLLDASLLHPALFDASTYSMSPTDSHGAIRGTPPYLSPEVLGGADASPADDLWSLSVTLLEACTGSNPFRGATPAASAARVMMDDGRVAAATANLPETVRQLINTLLDRRLDRRPSTAAELQRLMKTVHQGVLHG